MVTKWEREYKIDQMIMNKFELTLQCMVAAGDITEDEMNRYLRKLSWHIPLPVNNKQFIEMVSLLQQKEGDEKESKRRTYHRAPMQST